MASQVLNIEELTLVSENGFLVEEFSIYINQGEIVAITGKSGSGKTSIALALLGLLPKGIRLTKGSIEFCSAGGDCYKYPLQAHLWSSLRGRHIGYIPQDVFGVFDPVLKLGQQMLMIIRERAHLISREPEEELKEKLSEVGIEDMDRIWNSYPHQLSGGQLQRCLICLSIVMRPSLIIADEPTSAIDKITQVELLNVFAHIRKKYNTAILCITHEPFVVKHLADREVSIDKSPGTRPTAGYISDPNIQGNDTLLEAKNLGHAHRFGGLIDKSGARISEINFQLSSGSCLGIIGESGSGKSTVAQMLVGLLVPSEGSIRLHSRKIDFLDRSDIRYLRSKVQLVMQDGKGSLHPNKTIRELLGEVVKFNLNLKGDIINDISAVLDEVGLPENILDRTASNLSGGECLRISLARALLMQPEVIICDESTSALDTNTRDSILKLLRHLMHHRNLSLILISHDENIIRQMAGHVLVFSDGTIVEEGPVERLIADPRHPATRKIFLAHATSSG